jgi:hypothetical protein
MGVDVSKNKLCKIIRTCKEKLKMIMGNNNKILIIDFIKSIPDIPTENYKH